MRPRGGGGRRTVEGGGQLLGCEMAGLLVVGCLLAPCSALHAAPSPRTFFIAPSVARSPPPLLQYGHALGPAPFEDNVDEKTNEAAGTISTKLHQDMMKGAARAATRERELIEPNSHELEPPNPKRRFTVPKASTKGKAAAKTKGGGGFGAGKTLTAAERATQLYADTVSADGICLVQDVLSKESAEVLLDCVADELAKAYAAVEEDPSTCVGRFNVPIETFDPLRGYLLLPLRDEKSVDEGKAKGPLVSALNELLQPGAKLGEIFSALCGGTTAELYDVVALRTEAGAGRQPIHFDTPYQKIPGLFCAFIAVHDVRYSQGTTVFLPGTHLNTKDRKAFTDGQHDGRRWDMLSKVES